MYEQIKRQKLIESERIFYSNLFYNGEWKHMVYKFDIDKWSLNESYISRNVDPLNVEFYIRNKEGNTAFKNKGLITSWIEKFNRELVHYKIDKLIKINEEIKVIDETLKSENSRNDDELSLIKIYGGSGFGIYDSKIEKYLANPDSDKFKKDIWGRKYAGLNNKILLETEFDLEIYNDVNSFAITFFHELLHALGIMDIYNSELNKYLRNTSSDQSITDAVVEGFTVLNRHSPVLYNTSGYVLGLFDIKILKFLYSEISSDIRIDHE